MTEAVSFLGQRGDVEVGASNPLPVASTSGGFDGSGAVIYPERYAQVLTYNADGTVNTIAFTDGTNTWTQTFTYTSGKVTGISVWVKS